MRNLLARWLDDERMKPRAERGRHPIPDDQLDLHRLTCQVGRLWDQVWWMSLPWYRRLGFRLLGFRAPIERFYLNPDEEWR